MMFNDNKFVLCQTFLTSFLIISCSILFSTKSTNAENIDKTNFRITLSDEDSSRTTPSIESKNPFLWRFNNKYPLISSLARMPVKNIEKFPVWFKTKRDPMEEMPPPGFVGARGRRLWDWDFSKPKRNPTEDYKTLSEAFPDLWPQLSPDQIETSTDQLMSARLGSGKKSDSIVYKDGFLGVRG